MSLVDFLQQLQNQDDSGIIYSQPPEPPVRVIPPEKSSPVQIIPPSISVQTPTKLRLNLKQLSVDVPLKSTETPKVSVPVVQQPPQQIVEPKPVETPIATPQPVAQVENVVEPPPVIKEEKPPLRVETRPNTPPTDEELFIRSGTEDSKRAIWYEYFNKAKASRKQNPVVDRMKIGKFTITPDNKVLILPDYDVVGKDPDSILKDSWF